MPECGPPYRCTGDEVVGGLVKEMTGVGLSSGNSFSALDKSHEGKKLTEAHGQPHSSVGLCRRRPPCEC